MEGQDFGPYRLERLIGSGGMGDVYQAFDRQRDRIVALKLLPELFSANEEFETRFRRESRMAARLREPHIIPIHDYGEIDGRLYIDMRLVDGGHNVASLVRDAGALAPERAVRLIGQAADALDAAHADGLVHRDVKPSNILVTQQDFVYVVDFGIAHMVGHTAAGITLSGATIGTLEYMAPERFNSRSSDRGADVYSLACVLYECLTAGKPFPGEDLPGLMYAHLFTSPRPPSESAPGIPPALDEVVARGMAKEPAERYPSTGALAEAARLALGEARPVVVTTRPAAPASAAAPEQTPGPNRSRMVVRPWDPTVTSRPRAARWPIVTGGLLAALLAAAIAAVLVVTQRPVAPTTSPASAPAIPAAKPAPAVKASVPVPALGPSIPTAATPDFAAVAPDGRFAYVLNRDPQLISVLDTASNRVTATIPVPAGPPRFVAFAPDGARAYVTIYDERDTVNLLAVVDTATNRVLANVPVDRRPFAATVSPDQRTVWVSSHDTGLVDVLDTASNAVIRRIQVAPNPHWVAFATAVNRVYVANHESNLLSVVDPVTYAVVTTIRVGTSPHSVAVSPDGRRVSVVNFDSNTVSVVDTATNQVVATIPVGRNPQYIGYAPDGRVAYTANADDKTITVIDMTRNAVTATLPTGGEPTSIALTHDGARGYVTVLDAARLAVLNTA
ncbi:serine/threonine-protein kinase [Pseudonocardia acaciae]|uniref:serine/threonine-protein kinase n=1 Tax=Pseudonocardia acaciae TaxID=551276 RepID=UPI00068513FA|nr:serine/threonine-protein kinase [Pseudonocardia acaciae]